MAPSRWQASPPLLLATPRLWEVFCLSPRGWTDRLAAWSAHPTHVVLLGARRRLWALVTEALGSPTGHWDFLHVHVQTEPALEGSGRGSLGTGNIPFLIWLLAAWVFLTCKNSSSYTFLYIPYLTIKSRNRKKPNSKNQHIVVFCFFFFEMSS